MKSEDATHAGAADAHKAGGADATKTGSADATKPGSGTTHQGGSTGQKGKGTTTKGGHPNEVIVNRTVIDEGFGPFWPIGPVVALEDTAIISAFGWQPTEAVVETVPLVDFGECHYHVVTDRVSGVEKIGVWVDGKEVIAGTDRAIERVLTNCTEECTPAATFAEVVNGFYPALSGYDVITTGPGILAPEIIRETNIERVTYFTRDKANETVKVNASWGPNQAVKVTTVKS